MTDAHIRYIAPFNGPLEIGLRSLCLLTEAHPLEYSLQRLVAFDYLVVHSDDVAGGPKGLHPKTPHRGGELLVRRETLQQGLTLFISRGMIHQSYNSLGVAFSATEYSGAFLDALETGYVRELRGRAVWVVEYFSELDDAELQGFVREHVGEWGAEFEMESVLWMEDPS